MTVTGRKLNTIKRDAVESVAVWCKATWFSTVKSGFTFVVGNYSEREHMDAGKWVTNSRTGLMIYLPCRPVRNEEAIKHLKLSFLHFSAHCRAWGSLFVCHVLLNAHWTLCWLFLNKGAPSKRFSNLWKKWVDEVCKWSIIVKPLLGLLWLILKRCVSLTC